MSKGAKRMSLKAFFEALEGRLDTLSAADLRSVIGNMAKAVSPGSRHAFLGKLEPDGKPEQAIAEALGQDDLLSDSGQSRKRPAPPEPSPASAGLPTSAAPPKEIVD